MRVVPLHRLERIGNWWESSPTGHPWTERAAALYVQLVASFLSSDDINVKLF